MRYIIRVVPLDRDAAAVDKAIEAQRCAQSRDLFDDLLHLSVRQWEIVQTVNAAIILKQNIGPVADQLRFAVVFQDSVFPALGFQQINQRLLKVRFLAKRHC